MPPETEEVPIENNTSVETVAEDLGKMTEAAAGPVETSEDSVEEVFEDAYEEDEPLAAETETPSVVEATTEPESDPAPVKEESVSAAPKEEEKAPETKPLELVPPVEPAAPAEPVKSRAEIRDGLIEEITGRYIISEEDTEILRVEPEKILPKLAGQMFVDVYEAVYHGVMSQIEGIVHNTVKQTSVASSNQSAFFKDFPDLNDDKYAEQLSQIGTMWRKSYPAATKEQAIEGIGNTAMAMLGLTKTAPAEATLPPAAKPKLPSVPAAAAVSSGELKPDVPDDPKGVLEILDYNLPDI